LANSTRAVVRHNRAAFYAALQSVRERDMDLTRWLEYFVIGLATQLEEVKARGKQAIRVDALVSDHNLNARQAKALLLILETGEITIHGLAQHCPGVNRRTLQRDLQGMIGKGLIVAEGATNQLRYRLKHEP